MAIIKLKNRLKLKHPSTGLPKRESFTHGRFSKANLTIFAIIFAAVGGYLIYSSFAAGTCTQTFTPSNYSASSVSSAATGGAVLCLSSGTYSAIELISVRPSSTVTIQPAPGASVTLGKITLTGVSNLTITGFSGSSSSSGVTLQGQFQGTNNNITFSYNAMTSNGVWIGNNDVANANILIDHNTFIGFATSGEQDRIVVNTANSTHCPNGVMISNNLIKGGRSDGIDIDGGTCGTKIFNNEITGILQANCGGIHCDAIQDNGGGMKTDIENNYLHGNSDGLLFDDGNTGPDIVRNNVFDNPTYRCIEGQYGDGSIFDHNTFDCEVNVGQDHSGSKTTNLTATNNVFGPSSNAGFSFYPSYAEFGSFKTVDYNLHSGSYGGPPNGAHDINGLPTLTGGTEPSTLAGWQLSTSSLGRNAASDGTDMGANIATVGIQSGTATTVSLTSSPSTISSGQSSTLTWSSTNATSCSAVTPAGWTSSTATSGSQLVSNIISTTTYTISCTGSGGTSQSSATVTISDITSPTITLTAPTNGSTVSGSSITISANSSDDVGVAGVQFKVDGSNVGSEDTSSPYSITWNTTNVSNGAHTITALARDTAGNTKTSTSVGVTVSNPVFSCSGSTAAICEDFASSAANFSSTNGTWAVSGGKYNLTSPVDTGNNVGLDNRSIHSTNVSGDFTFTVDSSVVGTAGVFDDFGVIFNYQDANNYYYASFNESNDTTTNGLFKVAGGTQTELADFSTTITSNTTYTIKVEKIGSTIKVSRDSTLLATVTDSTFTTGKVGFGSRNDSATFDNLVVTTSTSSSKVGDINKDGNVDIFDLSILLSNYNTATASCDLNSDSTVNIFDLSILLSNYGT